LTEFAEPVRFARVADGDVKGAGAGGAGGGRVQADGQQELGQVA
jgi:hypothetical protein